MNEQYKKFAERCWDYDHNGMSIFDPMKFAHLVAHHEREACAKLAEEQLRNTNAMNSMPPMSQAAWAIWTTIKARGEVK